MTTVLTIGTFDTPHVGHVVFLRKCEQFGDRVIVGVNADAFVKEYKGAAPKFSEAERMSLIGLLGYETRLNDGPGHQLIATVRPDFLVVGSDWATRDYHEQIATTQEYLDEHGITLVFVPYTRGISSSRIKLN